MYIKNNKRYTKIYRKQTDRQSSLHIDSEHPKSLKVSISYIQAIRIKRICATSQDFHYHCKELKQRFLEQRCFVTFFKLVPIKFLNCFNEIVQKLWIIPQVWQTYQPTQINSKKKLMDPKIRHYISKNDEQRTQKVMILQTLKLLLQVQIFYYCSHLTTEFKFCNFKV